jgi:hypothetical protein
MPSSHFQLMNILGEMYQRGSLGQRVSFYWWMSAEWAARDEQPILPTSTNPCITRAAGALRVKTGMKGMTKSTNRKGDPMAWMFN